MDDTLDEEDFLMIFVELEVQTHLYKSRYMSRTTMHACMYVQVRSRSRI